MSSGEAGILMEPDKHSYDAHARGGNKVKAPVSTFVQSRVTLYVGPLALRSATKQSALDCVCFDPTSGTMAAYPPSLIAMGGSRRPCSDQHFITVRESALQAWEKDVTVFHSIWLQTMLFLSCLLVGCWGLKLFGCLWSFVVGGRS